MASRLFVFFEKAMAAFSGLFALALGGMVVCMCLDIGMRNFGLGSLPWVIEISEYLMYGGTFLAAPYVLRQGGHVRVDALLVVLPKAWAANLERLVDVLGMVVALVLAYFGAVAVRDAWANNMIQFKTWNVPEWLLLTPIAIGGAMLVIEFALRIARVKGVVREEYSILDRPSI